MEDYRLFLAFALAEQQLARMGWRACLGGAVITTGARSQPSFDSFDILSNTHACRSKTLLVLLGGNRQRAGN